MKWAYLGLGSNLGDKANYLRQARVLLAAVPEIELCACSSLYRTAPIGEVEQDWFLNQVLSVKTTLSPEALLQICLATELKLGRTREVRWGPRTVDIDVLDYENCRQKTDTLTLPHPHLFERAFVLKPWSEIAPHHKIAGKPVSDWLLGVESQEVQLWAKLPVRGKPSEIVIPAEYTGPELLECFSAFPQRSLLESASSQKGLGRYTIFAHSPHKILRTRGSRAELFAEGIWSILAEEPLVALRALLAENPQEALGQVPFVGGAIGYFSYDLCHQIESLPRTAKDDLGVDEMYLFFYDSAIVVDHQLKQTHLVAASYCPDPSAFFEQAKACLVNSIVASEESSKEAPAEPQLEANMTPQDYVSKVEQVKAFIASGDIYQVNLAQRFTARCVQQPAALYAQLTKLNPAPFAAYLEWEDNALLSSSPERFLRLQGKRIQTRPIKGTRPRGNDVAEDQEMQASLLASEKERAELLMIVDLERNDLGRVCEPGTIQVEALYEVESYPTVHHLVGEVSGELRPEVDRVDCLKATFPGGSITGAPKVRAMQIIDQIEPNQRSAFTGSIGYFSADGQMDLNIAIRTLLLKEGMAYLQVGAGIVWDSEPESEYQETLDKAKALFEALGISKYSS